MASAVEAMSLTAMRYSRVAMWFHWIIAALIVLNLLLGFFRGEFDRPVASVMMTVHKATGFTILALSVARLAWRIGNRPPAFESVLARWEVALARLTHAAFYALMIIIPLTGWLLSSSNGRSTSFFWLFDIPPLPVSRSEDSHELWEQMHGLLGYAITALLALHIAGAAKHHFQGHRHLIGRMGPWLYRQR